MGPSPTFSFFVLFDGVDALWHNLTVSLIFFIIFYSNITRSMFSDIYWTVPLLFLFFCLDFKIKSSPTYFGAFPYFLQFFSVLMWLTISDIIWPPPFFFIILYRIITRSMFSDIFWPSPLIFLSGVQNWIFSDIFWGLLLLFTFDDLKFFFFLIIFYPIITRSIFSDIFWLFRLFF